MPALVSGSNPVQFATRKNKRENAPWPEGISACSPKEIPAPSAASRSPPRNGSKAGRSAPPISGTVLPATTSSRRRRSSRTKVPKRSRPDGTPLRPTRWFTSSNRREGDDGRCHGKTTPADRERPGRRPRGATAERRPHRPYRTADDRQGQRQGVLRDPQLRRVPRHGNQPAAAALG